MDSLASKRHGNFHGSSPGPGGGFVEAQGLHTRSNGGLLGRRWARGGRSAPGRQLEGVIVDFHVRGGALFTDHDTGGAGGLEAAAASGW